LSLGHGMSCREAGPADVQALSVLAEQLGYAAASGEIAGRLARMDRAREQVIVVADVDGRVVGWAGVRATEHIHSGAYAEVSGFVVDEAHRGRGAGRLLMSAVEGWAREKRLPAVRLSANVTRTGAHRFYESLGFEQTKQQFAFRKKLG
jgi:GNAT superfamily N-acetyltransferase